MTEVFDYSDITPEATRWAAHIAAEAIRVANHLTREPGGLKCPEDVEVVLADLEQVMERLPQLLTQVGAWLVTEAQAARVEVRYGTFAARPAAAVVAVRGFLTEAVGHAGRTRQALHDARQITAAIAAAPGDDEEKQ